MSDFDIKTWELMRDIRTELQNHTTRESSHQLNVEKRLGEIEKRIEINAVKIAGITTFVAMVVASGVSYGFNVLAS